jgi:hypothetical protein
VTAKPSSKSGGERAWSDVKRQLSELAKPELLGLLRDLWGLAAENRQFVHARLRSDSALTPYLATVESCLYPDPLRNERLRLRDARHAIGAYRKATSDVHGTVQLQLRYVECGTAFAVDFAALDDTLVDSLISMFQDVAISAANLPEREAMLARLRAIVESAEGLGWGYYDAISDILETVQNAPTKRPRSGA